VKSLDVGRLALRSVVASARGTAYGWPAFVAAAALAVATAIVEPAFYSPNNWSAASVAFAPFVLVSMAQAAPIVSGNGGLDLSVGPVAGFMTVLIAAELVPHGITSPALVIPIVIGAGAAIGLLNGVLVAYGRLPAVIVTLAAYLVASGVALQLLPSPGGEVPGWLTDMAGSYGPIPAALVLVGAVFVAWIALQATAYRRNLLIVGGDDRLAFTSGVNVAAIRVGAYVVAGIVAACAGLALAASLGSGDPTVGPNYSLISFAGVALGGVSLVGGRGGMLGAAAGGAILFLIQNLLTVDQVSTFHQQIVEGAILLLALTANSFALKLRQRRYDRSGGVAGLGFLRLPLGTPGGSDTLREAG
jgi:ribose transport system permease protein